MSESKRTVKLSCPSLSMAVQLVARDDHRLDLGSIARTFGLDPATLKLNGHFISRGVDLIASSVTWKSLISFFSSRGLSTGINGSGALVVDGKLSKSGSKRANDSVNEIPSKRDCRYACISRKPLFEEMNLSKKMKIKDFDVDRGSDKRVTINDFGSKRKQEHTVGSSLKRLRVDESDSQTRKHTKTWIECGLLGVNMKRTREDHMVVPASCKKIRWY